MFRNEIHILQWQERNQYGDADTFLCEIIITNNKSSIYIQNE